MMKTQQLDESNTEGAGLSSLETPSQTPLSHSNYFTRKQSCCRNERRLLPGSASGTQQLPETRARKGSSSSNQKATSGCLKSIFNYSVISSCPIKISSFIFFGWFFFFTRSSPKEGSHTAQFTVGFSPCTTFHFPSRKGRSLREKYFVIEMDSLML